LCGGVWRDASGGRIMPPAGKGTCLFAIPILGPVP
jgi:hypothetical protein